MGSCVKLARVRYISKGMPGVFAGLVIGEQGGLTICLKSEFLTQSDASSVMMAIKAGLFKDMNLEDKVRWCMSNLSGYKKAYRSLKTSQMVVEQTYAG